MRRFSMTLAQKIAEINRQNLLKTCRKIYTNQLDNIQAQVVSRETYKGKR